MNIDVLGLWCTVNQFWNWTINIVALCMQEITKCIINCVFSNNYFHMQEYICVLYNYTVNTTDSTYFARRVFGLLMF